MGKPACRTGRENLHPILANIRPTILISSSLTSATVAEPIAKAIGLKPKPVKLYNRIQPKKCPLSQHSHYERLSFYR
jgi:hypothetical protein